MAKNNEKIDGLDNHTEKQIRTALRRVWSWGWPHRIVKKRCTGADGFGYCEQCGLKCPKIYVDHIVNVGAVDGGFIARLFVPSNKLQGLCHACHRVKTNLEKRLARQKLREANDDFF